MTQASGRDARDGGAVDIHQIADTLWKSADALRGQVDASCGLGDVGPVRKIRAKLTAATTTTSPSSAKNPTPPLRAWRT
jgi:hypothetical protein